MPAGTLASSLRNGVSRNPIIGPFAHTNKPVQLIHYVYINEDWHFYTNTNLRFQWYESVIHVGIKDGWIAEISSYVINSIITDVCISGKYLEGAIRIMK